MILVTDISGSRIYLNSDLIERVECVPDTIIFLANGHRYIIRESPADVVRLIEGHKRRSTLSHHQQHTQRARYRLHSTAACRP